MIWLLFGLTTATAASWTLPNGVRVTTAHTAPHTGALTARWTVDVGSADGPAAATALALAVLAQGPSSDAGQRRGQTKRAHRDGLPLGGDPYAQDARWHAIADALPAPILNTDHAGFTVSLSAEHLGAWASATAKVLADPGARDLQVAIAAATTLSAPVPPALALLAGASAFARPAAAPADLAALTVRAVDTHLAQAFHPDRLTVTITGDLSEDDVHAAIDAPFSAWSARAPALPPAPAPAPPLGARTEVITCDCAARLVAAHVGASDGLTHELTALAHDTLADATDLTITPHPGRFAYTTVTTTLSPTRDDVALADRWRAAVARRARSADCRPDIADALATPPAVVLWRHRADDPEIDALVRSLGPTVGELLRIRLGALASADADATQAMITSFTAERDLVAPPLRPALDLLLTRAAAHLDALP